MRGLNEIGDQGAVAVATAQDLEDLDEAVGTVETVNMVVGLWRASDILRLSAITTSCPS